MSRVLVLCTARGIPVDGPSGASAHLRGVSRALSSLGHDVHVATPLRSDQRGSHDPLQLPFTGLPPRRWPSWLREHGETWDSRALAQRAVASARPDILWERHTLFGDGGRREAERRGIPRLVELNAPLSLERPGVRGVRRAERLERENLQRADRVIAVSEWLADWAVQQGVSPARVRHVPNGTSLTALGRRDATRRRLGLTGLVVGFVGTHKPWHGLGGLPAVLESVPEATALVVGDGPAPVPDHPRLRRVPWTPPGALADLVAAMDVGLVPYPPSAPPWFCPLKVFDYHSQGVPVVASPHPSSSLADITVQHGSRGWATAIREAACLPRRRVLRSWEQVVQEALAGWRIEAC